MKTAITQDTEAAWREGYRCAMPAANYDRAVEDEAWLQWLRDVACVDALNSTQPAQPAKVKPDNDEAYYALVSASCHYGHNHAEAQIIEWLRGATEEAQASFIKQVGQLAPK
jgi:hypothetical protein